MIIIVMIIIMITNHFFIEPHLKGKFTLFTPLKAPPPTTTTIKQPNSVSVQSVVFDSSLPLSRPKRNTKKQGKRKKGKGQPPVTPFVLLKDFTFTST